jgi:hypothetical protein
MQGHSRRAGGHIRGLVCMPDSALGGGERARELEGWWAS